MLRYVWQALNSLSIHIKFTAIVQVRTQGRPKCAETDARSVGDSHPFCWVMLLTDKKQTVSNVLFTSDDNYRRNVSITFSVKVGLQFSSLFRVNITYTEAIWFRQLSRCIVHVARHTWSPSNRNTNKKYVLWNTGICPIASKVGHVTLATPLWGHSSSLM